LPGGYVILKKMCGSFFRGCSSSLSLLVLLIALPEGAFAQQQFTQPDVAGRRLAAEEFVKARLVIWQERLKLDDWKILIVMSRSSELKPHSLGNIRWDKSQKSAVIRVLDVSEYKLGPREMLNDMEFTVLHELIHLQLSSLPRSEASRSDEEHAVNRIADALLKLDRRN
jgi:hypothetical protein